MYGFARKSSPPTSRQRARASFSDNDVRKMIGTRVSPARALICRAASKPSMTGIIASINTRCGCCWRNVSTASAPLAAVSTSCPRRRRMLDSSRRSAALSSAIRIVSGSSGCMAIN
ncbi:hypothetical protein D3C86_1357770 [compost metagenome]